MTFYASLALESSEIWEGYYKSLLYNSHGKISYEAIRTEFSYLPMHVTTDLHLTYMATHGLEKICSSSWWEEILHSWHRAAACPWALSHRESCVSSPVPAAGGWPWGALRASPPPAFHECHLQSHTPRLSFLPHIMSLGLWPLLQHLQI